MPDQPATPKFVVLSGLAEGQSLALTEERVGVGRGENNLIRFDDPSVSLHHAIIERVDAVHNLRDLGSINGTFVNGRRVSEIVLRDGDLVRFGGVDARYEWPPEMVRLAPATPGPAAETPKPSPSPPPRETGRKRKAETTPAQLELPQHRTYKIVGTDGRVYGPVGAEQIHGWIKQGLVNGQTWVPSDKGRQWQRIDEYPEFAETLLAYPSSVPLLGVPPDEFLWQGALKVGPAPETSPQFPKPVAPAGRSAKRRGDDAVAGEESGGRGLFWPFVVLLFAAGGFLAIAHQYIWWPFTTDGPLRQFARNVEERIGTDPAYEAATAAEDAGNNAELLQQAQLLADRYPRSSQAHYILGIAHSRLDALDKAAADFQRAVDLRADYVDAWNNLGWVHTRRGNLGDAVAAFQQTIQLAPDDAQAWSNLGGALAGMSREDEAIEAYRKSIELDADYAQAHYNLGVSLAKQRNFREAVTSLRQAIRLKPDFAEAWFNLGVVSQMQGQDDGAVVFYQQAVKLRADYADAWGGLVKAYLKLGQPDRASEAADQIKALDPDKAEALAEELRRIAPR
jgi:tetratricopeptide (TPR) repeat protein